MSKEIKLTQISGPASPNLPAAQPNQPRFAQEALVAACPNPGAAPQASLATSLYIHIPFCFHKCHYCDFYSIVDTRDRQEVFTTRLESELRALAPYATKPLHTIFIGGGTPTLLRPELWHRVLRVLHENYQINADTEFTVEANPETVTLELMQLLRSGGVNRISMGAQSFNKSHLKTLERWHDPDNIPRALEHARSAGIHRLSLDLIYAIPNQTLAEWDADLRRALALNTDHLSCYTLTYEPNTAMTMRLKQGQFQRADEDLEADMFEHTVRTLREHNLDRYEVSNFARPTQQCQHNLAYWRQHNWLAAGPSASAHMNGHRWKNTPRLDDYLTKSTNGFSAITDFEPADERRNLGEYLWTSLRTTEGINLQRVETSIAQLQDSSIQARINKQLERHQSLKNLTTTNTTVQLTDQGFMIADSIAVDLLAAIDE
ncbi:MAG: radical SAM family heme chaperone HemW [Phycisphaerales bacterium]